MIIFVFILSGLLALYFGAELLIRYSVHLAGILGLSPLVIGLTVVAYGTSTPELMVNVIASLSGKTEIALGNVVGSNIFNVLFILGLSALVYPLIVHKQIIHIDVPVMIIASAMTWIAASFGRIEFWTGIIFFSLIVLYTVLIVYLAKKSKNQIQNEFEKAYTVKEPFFWRAILKDIGWVILSLVILVIGSQLLVKGSVLLAQNLGVSELVISLTIVAAGTSFPELATSVVAAMRGQRDIAVGNIVGSNIYNIWAILGLSAILSPDGIPVPDIALHFDLPIMVAVAIACLPIFWTGHTIHRWEGALFLGYYIAYLIALILRSTSSSWLHPFQNAIIFFVLPLSVLTLLIGTMNYYRTSK